jgi:hypothetical protein
MNQELRELLQAVRTIVAFIAKLTPFEGDDRFLEFLDYLLGNPPPAEVPAHVAKLSIPWDRLPWDKILPLLLPLLLQVVEKWLASLGGKK